MEHGGDRVGKDAVGVRVQGVERLRHGGDLHFAGGVHILIEDEAHFLFLHLLDLIAAADVALDKAGAYGIQGLAALFVTRLEGDFYNVMGLPIQKVYVELDKFLDR